ncbi:MAG TPA: hypothetical protein VH541_10575 [Gaiellaceae bacterium]
MFGRRFVLLGTVLVALNVVLWFAAPGFAIRKAIVNELFGPRMVRAVVVEKNGSQWQLDRGVIIQVSSTQLTLREADTKIQVIPLASTTDVVRFGHHLSPDVLAKRWHVLVTWPSTGPAQSVDVEKIPRGRTGQAIG